MLSRRAFLLLAASALLPCVAHAEEPVLSLGIVPINSVLALMRAHQPIREHLQNETGARVDLFTSPDFFTFLNESLEGRYDLLITPPHFGAMSIARGYRPLVRYSAPVELVLVVGRDSAIRGLQDVRGQTIGVSSRLSMATIQSIAQLETQNLYVDEDYALREYVSAGAALSAVAFGDADGTFTARHALRLIPEELVDALRFVDLPGSPPHIMTLAHERLGEARIRALREALLRFPDTEAGRQFFDQSGLGGYTTIDRDDLVNLQATVLLTRRLLARSARQ